MNRKSTSKGKTFYKEHKKAIIASVFSILVIVIGFWLTSGLKGKDKSVKNEQDLTISHSDSQTIIMQQNENGDNVTRDKIEKQENVYNYPVKEKERKPAKLVIVPTPALRENPRIIKDTGKVFYRFLVGVTNFGDIAIEYCSISAILLGKSGGTSVPVELPTYVSNNTRIIKPFMQIATFDFDIAGKMATNDTLYIYLNIKSKDEEKKECPTIERVYYATDLNYSGLLFAISDDNIKVIKNDLRKNGILVK